MLLIWKCEIFWDMLRINTRHDLHSALKFVDKNPIVWPKIKTSLEKCENTLFIDIDSLIKLLFTQVFWMIRHSFQKCVYNSPNVVDLKGTSMPIIYPILILLPNIFLNLNLRILQKNLTLALWQFSKLLTLYAYKALICSLFSNLRILWHRGC